MNRLLKIENFLIFAGILSICGFALRLGTDIYKIHIGINSGPFKLLILERAFDFLLPGFLCFAAAALIKKHNKAK